MKCFRIVFYNKVRKEYKLISTYYRQFESKEQAKEYADTFNYDLAKIREIPTRVFMIYNK